MCCFVVYLLIEKVDNCFLCNVFFFSNIDTNENLSLLLNFLYSVNELSSGFFTCRLEMVLLKCFLQRLFSKLPDCHKEHIIKMFPPEESIEVWRVLGFQHLSPTQVQPLLEPIVSMTGECIRSFEQEVNEEDIVNIVSTNSDVNDIFFNRVVAHFFYFVKLINYILKMVLQSFFLQRHNEFISN